MSFDHLSSLEAQPPQYRDDPETRDDQEFNNFAENLSVQLFGLTSSISRLSQQINLLGTKRDTERVRERVSDLLEETRDGFKDVGEKMRKLAAWEDVNVGSSFEPEGAETHSLLTSCNSPPKNIPSRSFRENSKHQAASFKLSSGKPLKNKERPPQRPEQQ